METKLGCFGSVLYHKIGTARCKSCSLLEACSQEVAENKAKLETWYADLVSKEKVKRASKRVGHRGIESITAPDAAPRARSTTTATTPLRDTGKALNKKPKQFVDNWCAKGIKFADYKDGVNPFERCGNKFAVVAMAYFMANKVVTRLQMTEELMDKCGWLPGTAASHSNIVFDTFEYLGIIEVTEGKGYLRS